jgi:hypothetical protein
MKSPIVLRTQYFNISTHFLGFVGCSVCFSFQKGFIAIEAVDEQEGENQDYNI